MTTNYMNGLCNLDHCTHPCCWNYYRKLIKHQVSPSDLEERKPPPIEVAHQSIHTFNADLVLNRRGNNQTADISRHRDTKQNALLDYLNSRKKLSSSTGSNSTPNINGHFRDTTNVNRSQNKISVLDVHEIFDLDELQSDWRKTFQAKDYYIWIPGNKELKNSKDDNRPMRTVKTPVLQLAPVTDSRVNSSIYGSARKDLSFVATGSEYNNQRTMPSKMRSMQRSTTRMEPLSDNSFFKVGEVKSVKETIRHKSLEAALNQAKMQIHSSNDRAYTRYEFTNPSQVYLMDENFHDNVRDLSYSSLSRQPPSSPNDSDLRCARPTGAGKSPKSNQVHFKGVSIIESVPCDNSFCLKLEPQQRRVTPLKSALSQRRDGSEWASEERSSVCDSMATNAISNRSTLNDDDILPGSSILHMLQNSYKLIQERSDNLSDREKDSSKNTDDRVHADYDVPLHKVTVSYSRNAKSAPDKKVIVDIPNPPPPTPDLIDRQRASSAAPTISFAE